MSSIHSFRDLPSVNTLLCRPQTAALIQRYGQTPVKEAVRLFISSLRDSLQTNHDLPPQEGWDALIRSRTATLAGESFKPVINATGIILHTNLGRAPLGEALVKEITPLLQGYSNLEFNLKKGQRGSRYTHICESLKLITGAEDAIVVNNNAASVILALNGLCQGGEVIISRGELIEIGGGFRLPEIFEAAGCRLVEVGATNKTRVDDYRRAITPQTKAILKVHRSNFAMVGFSTEAGLSELRHLCDEYDLPLLYDQGCGLLRKPKGLPLENEPDVQTAIASGADLVMFSGDKLLGGPQAGILCGKAQIIKTLSRTPLLRALRISKLDLAALVYCIRQYMDDDKLKKNIPVFAMLVKQPDLLLEQAQQLMELLNSRDIAADTIESFSQVGGGTLPDVKLPSHAVRLISEGSQKERQRFAEGCFKKLMANTPPVVAILREGELLFDLRTLFPQDFPQLADAVEKALRSQREHP